MNFYFSILILSVLKKVLYSRQKYENCQAIQAEMQVDITKTTFCKTWCKNLECSCKVWNWNDNSGRNYNQILLKWGQKIWQAVQATTQATKIIQS